MNTNKVETTGLLLDSVTEDHNIKAAVLVDSRGYLIEKRGNAMSLRNSNDDDTIATAKGLENLYVVEVKENYLIVVFDEKMSFERIKSSVDDVLSRFDLAP